MTEELRVDINEYQRVTALIYPAKPKSRAGINLILGHGAGAGQLSGFMVSFATELAARGIDAVTFNFSYTENGRHIPDKNDKLEACYLSVIETVRKHKKLGRNKLAIGGKSMGGRIASQVAASGIEGVSDLAGLVFLGYPLHPPGNLEKMRSKHLPDIKAPMLFVQGSRDSFGTPDELKPILKKLKTPAELYAVEGGDHSFKVPKSAGVTQEEVYRAVLDKVATWLKQK
ncbi:MAG TPA: alpha/beta family hydrolase [Blastocatellia bacterium]|nr:alpha/beta family hydrolase [Blastocatellia bacterium]